MEIFTHPDADFARMLREYPDCVAAEPFPERTATAADDRIGKVIGKLQADPGLRYVMDTHIEPEAVILSLAIKGEAACELRIPNSRYDGIALLELIEKHTTRETLQ